MEAICYYTDLPLHRTLHAMGKLTICLSQVFAVTFWTAVALAAWTTWSTHAASYPVNRPLEPRALFGMVHYFALFAAPLAAIGSLFGVMGRAFFIGCLVALINLLWRA